MEAGTYTFGVGLSCYLGIDKGNYIEGYGLTIKVQELWIKTHVCQCCF